MPRVAVLPLAICLSLASSGPTPAFADDRAEHFKDEPSSSFVDVIDQLATANGRLRELTEGRTPSAAELHEIHVASYTMEIEIARVRAKLDASAEALERLHPASERADATTARAAARDDLGAGTPRGAD